MQKPFFKSLVFIVILVFIHISLIQIYYRIMSNSAIFVNDKAKKRLDLNKIRILALGDSHTGASLYPMDRSMFIWASGGESYILNYYRLKNWLEKDKLDYLILPLDLHSFSQSRNKKISNDLFWQRYVDYYEVGRITGDKKHFIKKYYKAKFVPYVGEANLIYQWFVKNVIKRKKKTKQINTELTVLGRKHFHSAYFFSRPKKDKKKKKKGYQWLSDKEKLRHSKQRVRFQLKNWNTFDPVMVTYFQKILDLCRTKNIKTILIKFPVSSEYYHSANKVMSTEKYYGKVNRIVAKYPDVYILDYHGIFFNKTEFLIDCDHANFEGKKIITRKVREYLLTDHFDFYLKNIIFRSKSVYLDRTENVDKIIIQEADGNSEQYGWGKYPRAIFKLYSPKAQSVQLQLQFRNLIKNQRIDIFVNKEKRVSKTINHIKRGTWRINTKLRQGYNSLVFRLKEWTVADSYKPLGLIFEKIKLF